MGCSVSVEVWIPGKGFAAVPSGVTFESRFEAVFFFRCGCGPPLIVEIRIPCWKGPMIATTCGYIGRSLIFHQLRHPRLGICCWNSTRFFELASGGIHVRLVVLSSTSLELASIQPMLLNIWWLSQRPAVKVFFFPWKVLERLASPPCRQCSIFSRWMTSWLFGFGSDFAATLQINFATASGLTRPCEAGSAWGWWIFVPRDDSTGCRF